MANGKYTYTLTDRCGVHVLILSALCRSRRDKEEGDSDSSEEESEEEEEEESEEESSEDGGDQPEMTRAERRELKKKQAAAKQPQKPGSSSQGAANGAEDGEEEDDESDLINPNRAPPKRVAISDLNSNKPRELSRKERYVCILVHCGTLLIRWIGKLRRRKKLKTGTGRYATLVAFNVSHSF